MPDAILNEQLLEAKLTELEKAKTWSPRIISRLESTIRSAADFDLFRINPVQYATEKNIAENEAIDLFLYAAKLGLFEMDWHIVCPSCGHIIDNFNDLAAVHPNAVCDVCSLQCEASLDDYIQVTFTISPQIRDIVFRHPETLSVEDFYLKYHLAKGMKTPDGTPLSEALRSLTRVMTYLSPGETTSAQFDVFPGILSGTDVLNKTTITLFTSQ